MSLRSFLEFLEKKKQVIHVKEEVSTKHEISSIMGAFQNGPALLFENVEGHSTKVVGNVCGTRERTLQALGVSVEEIYAKHREAMLSPEAPKVVDDCSVKEVVEPPRLSKIPVLTHFEKDAGAYITSGVVSAKSPDGEVENVSIHRLQVLNDRQLAIRLVPRHLYRLWTMAKEKGEDLDVAISIGVHPAVLLAAACSPPFGVSEFGVANRLLGGRLSLVKCEKVDAYAVAEAELVLEGKISVTKEVVEGPLVDITGTYDVQRSQPVVDLVSVMHRKDYVYQALLPGGSEHRILMGLPREAAIYEAVSNVVPKVKAVNLTSSGCGWLHAVISIEKQTDGDAKNALLAAFAGHPSLKHAVVVDSDIDVYNPEQVEWAIALRFQADEDLVVIPKARGSTLDPSADQESGLTSKLGIDATRPLRVPKDKGSKAKIPKTGTSQKIITKICRELSE
ncbi:UbiD family decarboxylase [Candidatus Bathyarchaeota archaeon]|nr:UbiD family decarboxylase [Candidatus Bathyarchaeota archaeon]